MEGFAAYVRLVRKRGPQPYWTPVAPVHRLVSYALSYVYVAAGLTPLAVTLLGLGLAVAGLCLLVGIQEEWATWAGLALLNLGVIHDACDGEVARYRLHHRMQSPATYRVGIFADFWAFAVVTQGLIPMGLGLLVLQRGGALGPAAAVAGGAACLLLLSSYVVAFARKAYWPQGGPSPVQESPSLAEGGGAVVRLLRRGYFQAFETAMFTTHATLVVAAWTLVAGTGAVPWWAEAYALAVALVLAAAFLVGHVVALRSFDPPAGAAP